MKKILILLLITLLVPISAFSTTTSTQTNQDSIVYVTAQDIKYANLIFIEHKKLIKENDILKKQVVDYEKVVEIANEVDSLRVEQIKTLDKDYTIRINSLNDEIKRKNSHLTYWKVGSVTVTIGLLLFILLK